MNDDEFDFTITLQGPVGCGKSTLLKHLRGLGYEVQDESDECAGSVTVGVNRRIFLPDGKIVLS